MDWNTVITSLISNAIIIAIATAVINHIANKRLDNYRYAQLQRQKAEVVAKFLAKWMKYGGDEDKILSNRELYDFYEELNTMSFQAILWLDKDLIEMLEESFITGLNEKNDIRPLLRQLRKYVLNTRTATTPKTIGLWPNDAIARRIFPHLAKKQR